MNIGMVLQMKIVGYDKGPYIILIRTDYCFPKSADMTHIFKAYLDNDNGKNFYFRTLTNKLIIISHSEIEYMFPCKESCV